MKDQISKTEDVSKQIQSVINQILDEQKEILKIEKSVEDEIDQTFNNLQQVLWNRRVNLKKTLKSNILSKQGHLKEQEDNLRRMKLDIEESNKFANQAIFCPSSPALLQVYPTIQNRLQNLAELYFDKEPHEMATFGFNADGLISVFQTKLDEMASIWSVSIFPPNCKAEVRDFLKENKSATFYVKLRDFQNMAPFKENGIHETNMDVVVKNPTGKKTKCSMEIKEGSTDELEVTVKPIMKGRHALEIRIHDKVVFRKEVETIHEPDLAFDRDNAHKDVSISADGKVFKNISAREQTELVASSSRLQIYKGAMSLKGIKYPGKYYYAVKIEMKVIKPLDKSNLVYELGIARKSVIGKKLVVEGQKFAWSMIGAHHVDCDAICLHIAHNNHLLYHEVLTKNETGKSIERVFGFLLDTECGQWKVFDHNIEMELCIIESVDCSVFLYPVVAGYNPNSVEVTATFMDV